MNRRYGELLSGFAEVYVVKCFRSLGEVLTVLARAKDAVVPAVNERMLRKPPISRDRPRSNKGQRGEQTSKTAFP